LLEELLGLDELTLRRHSTKLELLRYKPERRAVLLLRTVQREGELEKHFLLRVHPPAVAAAAARSRASCTGLVERGLGPRLLGCEERTGTLVEERLEGEAPAPDRFEHAEQMGSLLARLHALPCPTPGPKPGATPEPAAPQAGEEVAAWFQFAPELQRSASGLSDLTSRTRTTWIHGDVHPDQVLIDGQGTARLIDLDGLALGDPQVDLASWIGDHLAQAPDVGFEDAAAPLLSGYREAGGRPGETASLVLLVAHQLALRAAASLRRLEIGAPDRAHSLLARARALHAESETL
ncbi:MAG: phosphotransferase, partial [Planctomycetota bacterium]